MRYLLFAILITCFPTSVLASDFGLSINMGQPGFYGQINLGNNYPSPQVIYPQPVLVREARGNVWEHQSPVYLHVPSHHSSNWHQHCHRYQACNQSVYFVRENWYSDVYAPHYNSYSNRQRNVDYQNRGYDNHRDDDYRERRHDSHRDYDDHYEERRYDSHRDRDGHYKGKHRDKREHRYDRKHKDKHDRGSRDKNHRDRDHDRH